MIRRATGSILFAIVAAACGSGDQGPVAGDEYAGLPADNIVTGLEYFVTRDGIRQAVLHADTGYFYEDSAQVHLVDVHLTLFRGTGEEAAELTSETGELNQRTEAMVARGNVVLLTVDGRRIETEVLHYDPRRQRIWSDVRTVHTQNGSRLEGDSFEAELDRTGQLRDLVLREPRGRAESVEIGVF
ncbi:MAG TPA: LPS export ABC transporter periplasmic protein LptC [Longimicrobiales bacterium]